jgi:membrane-associated phospholipid phosphatase
MVISVVVFALVAADVITGGPLTFVDAQVRQGVQTPTPAVPVWMAILSAPGDVGIAAASMGIAGLVAAHARWRLWPLGLAAGNFVAVETLIYGAKTAVARPGPGIGGDRTGYPGYFPSGHSATAAVSAGTVLFLVLASRWAGVRLERAFTLALAAGLVVGLVTAVRAVLGDFHWVSDGLGGLAVGALVLTFGFSLARSTVDAPVSTPASRRGR